MGKICVYCNQDCSNRPRLKDALGRYACKACAEKHQATEAPAGAAGAAVPASASAPAPEAGVFDDAMPASVIDEAVGSNTYALAEPAETGGLREQRLCPACSRAMMPDAVICTSCGYDARKGFQVGTGIGADSRKGGVTACRKCGYSLKGLKSNKCPECGEVAKPLTYAERRARDTKKQVINAYRTPAIVLAVGAGLVLLALNILANKWSAPLEDVVVWYGVSLGVSLPTALVAFAIAGVLWMGFNAPVPLLILQFTATILLSDAAGLLVMSVAPVRMAIWAATTAVFFVTLVTLMEFDAEDAAIYIGIVIITSMVMRMTLAPWLLELMGYQLF